MRRLISLTVAALAILTAAEPIQAGPLFGLDLATEKLVTIDTASGAATDVASLTLDSSLQGLAFDRGSGSLFALDAFGGDLKTIDPATGAISDIASSVTTSARNLAPGDGGTLYSVDQTRLLSIDTSTGSKTKVSDLVNISSVTGLAFNGTNDALFAVSSTDNRLVRIDTTTFAETIVGDLTESTLFGVQGLAFDGSGTLFGSKASNDTLVTIDTSTGVATEVGSLGSPTINALAFQPDEEAGAPPSIDNGDFEDGTLGPWSASGAGTADVVDFGGNMVAQLTTGSEVILSQDIDTPALPFFLDYDFRFLSSSGILDVLLDGMVIDTLDAADFGPMSSFATRNLFIEDAAKQGLSGAPLEFRWDHVDSGKQVQLDNVSISTVPEPTSLSLLAVGAVCLGGVAGRRRRKR